MAADAICASRFNLWQRPRRYSVLCRSLGKGVGSARGCGVGAQEGPILAPPITDIKVSLILARTWVEDTRACNHQAQEDHPIAIPPDNAAHRHTAPFGPDALLSLRQLATRILIGLRMLKFPAISWRLPFVVSLFWF
jgi:hypothetical protein